MTQAKMISILVNSQPGRKQEQKITFSEKKLRNFFSDKYTAEDMESVILELLDQWKRGEITVCIFCLLYQVASATASPKYVVLLLFFKEICFPQNKSSSFFIYVLLLNHHKTT